MQLEHSFSVPAPADACWQALLDPERVAPCFPGATLTGVEGDEFTGTVKVRLGPVSLLYRGTGRFAAVDDSARRLVLEATGKDSRGNGTASATVTATLAGEGDSTTVGVITNLTITGRPAQMGRGLIAEVGGKILDAFAECLASKLAGAPAAASSNGAGGTAAGGTAAGGSARLAPATGSGTARSATAGGTATSGVRAVGPSGPAPDAASLSGAASTAPVVAPAPVEEIDLINLAGRPVLKRLVPVLTGLLAVLLVLRWLRRRG